MLPFAIKPKTELAEIGSEETGKLYLKKVYGRTGRERVELDPADQSQTKSQLALLKLASKVADDLHISKDEALLLVLSSDTNGDLLLNYLDDITAMVALKEEVNQFKELVATVLIRDRVAYPVVIADETQASITNLPVNPLSFPLYVGDRIKYKDCILECVTEALEGEETISVKPTSKSFVEGDTGFLLDGKDYRIGNADWTLENTRELPEKIIDAIYEFYQLEASGGVAESNPKKEASRKVSKSSKNTQKESLLTGSASTSESNPTE